MKICPACDRTYHDDELNFCLMCGVSLLDGAAQPTVMIRSDSEPTIVMQTTGDPTEVISAGRPTIADQKKHGIVFWIAVTLACIVGVSGATLGGFFLYFLFTGDDGKSVNQNRDKKVAVPSRTPEKLKPTPATSPTPDLASPTPVRSEGSNSNEIEWVTTAMAFRAENFERETFLCPPDGVQHIVFGSDIYAANSSICTAAVHAGKISFEKGGRVTIIFGPGLKSYVVSERNGIMPYMFGDETTSFVFE